MRRSQSLSTSCCCYLHCLSQKGLDKQFQCPRYERVKENNYVSIDPLSKRTHKNHSVQFVCIPALFLRLNFNR